MNIESVPTSADSQSDIATPSPAAEVLRALLNEPKPKDEAWQGSAGRAVSMLAVAFLNENDDVAALRAVALLSLAQVSGVKEARKRALTLTRWATQDPPPLALLPSQDERISALATLSKLRASWARGYLDRELADPATADELLPELLKWARSLFPHPGAFVHDLYAALILETASPQRCVALIKDSARLLRPIGFVTAVDSATMTSQLIEAFCSAPALAKADDKLLASMVSSVISVLQEQSAAYPAVLLQPAFVLAVAQFRRVIDKGGPAKAVSAVSETLSFATVSLLIAEIQRAGSVAVAEWLPMMPLWRSAYTNWDDQLTGAAHGVSAIQALIDGKAPEATVPDSNYEAEAVFARLLPVWEVFVAELPDASRVTSLNAMLLEAAATVSVFSLGRAGELVAYNPLAHHLASDSDAVPSKVVVVRPGVEARRADGSARVLVQALVMVA